MDQVLAGHFLYALSLHSCKIPQKSRIICFSVQVRKLRELREINLHHASQLGSIRLAILQTWALTIRFSSLLSSYCT